MTVPDRRRERHCIAFRGTTKAILYRLYSVNSNGPWRPKVVDTSSYRAGGVGREGLVHYQKF